MKTGEDEGQEAYVSGFRSLVFSEITEDMILKEHDPDCRTVEGLAKCLRETYPDFTEDSMVTLVEFTMPCS